MAASQTITVGALGVCFVLEAAASGGGATAFECAVPAGAVMPAPHSHDGFDETNYGLAGVTTFTRTSVHCAERIVATVSSHALRCVSAQTTPGYVSARRSRIAKTRSGASGFRFATFFVIRLAPRIDAFAMRYPSRFSISSGLNRTQLKMGVS